MTGDITMDNDKAVIFKETTANGTDSVTVKAPASVTTSYTIQLPPAVASANQVLTDVAGNGVLSWTTPTTGMGTVNSGTATHLAYYATSTNAVSDASGHTVSGTYTFSDSSNFSSTSGNPIHGNTASPAVASAGYVGEVIESTGTGAIPAALGNLTSIALTTGSWNICAMVVYNGAAGNTYLHFGISVNSASFTGTTEGYDAGYSAVATAVGVGSGTIPSKKITIVSPTTYYLIGSASSNYGGSWSISAIRTN